MRGLDYQEKLQKPKDHTTRNSSIRRTDQAAESKPGTKRDFLIKGIYEDVHKFTPTQDIEPTTSTPNKKIFEKKRKELFKAKPNKNPKRSEQHKYLSSIRHRRAYLATSALQSSTFCLFAIGTNLYGFL